VRDARRQPDRRRPMVETEQVAGVTAGAPAGVSLPLDAVKIGARHRRDMGDIDALARSIADVGLLHPVVVRPDGMLIAGARRIAACRRLGWSKVPVRIMETPDP
jgi:ParB-like chromosome segregation protein Spo0J